MSRDTAHLEDTVHQVRGVVYLSRAAKTSLAETFMAGVSFDWEVKDIEGDYCDSEETRGQPIRRTVDCTYVIGDRIKVTFPGIEGGLVALTCRDLISRRRELESAGKIDQSKAMKVTANSIYGATACSDYPSYSPICASCITGGSRWALAVLRVVSEFVSNSSVFRLDSEPKEEIIYGDTDSVFISSYNAL